MGYCISYNPELDRKYPMGKTKKKKKWIGFSAVLAVVLLAGALPNTKETVKDWLLPGDAQVTEAALTCFVQDVKEGVSVKEAFTVFCLEIMESAELAK